MAQTGGLYICIAFTEALVGECTGNEAQFTISWSGPLYRFGRMENFVRKPIATYVDPTDSKVLILEFDTGNVLNIQNADGLDVTVEYSGVGTLRGIGGPVKKFSQTFIPLDMIPKNNQNDIAKFNIEVSDTVVMIKVKFLDVKYDEKFTVTPTYIADLIHIKDI